MSPFLLAFLAFLAFPAAPVSAQTQMEGPDEAGLPADLLAGLRRQSEIYRRAVLRFACLETLLEEDVEPGTSDLKGRRDATYRYLLQADPEEPTVSEYREILSRSGVPVRPAPVVVQTYMPPPYLWATLFETRNASRFRYQLLGGERRGVTETLVIAFEGQEAFQEGSRLAEWSGRIWVDRDRLVPVHLEAVPARQEEALAAALERYRKAFRLGGMRLRAMPRARLLKVDFLVSRYGLNFPSQADWQRQVVDAENRRGTERLVRSRFDEYRFINIRTEEILGPLLEGGEP